MLTGTHQLERRRLFQNQYPLLFFSSPPVSVSPPRERIIELSMPLGIHICVCVTLLRLNSIFNMPGDRHVRKPSLRFMVFTLRVTSSFACVLAASAVESGGIWIFGSSAELFPSLASPFSAGMTSAALSGDEELVLLCGASNRAFRAPMERAPL